MNELLISDRPPDAPSRASGMGSSSGGDHYRGVMLSTRPPQERGRKFNVGQVPIPFVPGGIVHKAVGLPPAHEEAERNVVAKQYTKEKRRKENVYNRHREFLKALQRLKEEEREEEQRGAVQEEAKRASLRESQARIRQGLMEGDPVVLDVLQKKSSPTALKPSKTKSTLPAEVSSPSKGAAPSSSSPSGAAPQLESSASGVAPKAKPGKKAKKRGGRKKAGGATASKPAWALTQEEAERRDQQVEEDEVDPWRPPATSLNVTDRATSTMSEPGSELPNLEDTLEDLDALGEEFDDFGDLESFYEALSDEEELPDDVVEVIPAQRDPETGETIKKRMVRRLVRRDRAAQRAPGAGGGRKEEGEGEEGVSEEVQHRLEKERLAKHLMHDPDVRSVHSRASVQQLMDRAAERRKQQAPQRLGGSIKPAPSDQPSSLHAYKKRGQLLEKEMERAQQNRRPEPVMVVHGERDSADNSVIRRRKDSKQTQNLPYLYRCPAI